MLTVETWDALKAYEGKALAVSPWLTIDQERIDLFAEASGDKQWIHVDVERCAKESPFSTTIAHGYLTLSLLTQFMQAALTLPPALMSVNYGLNRVRFPAPVPCGSQVRARIALAKMTELAVDPARPEVRGVELIWNASMERAGSAKPVCVVESISRRYF